MLRGMRGGFACGRASLQPSAFGANADARVSTWATWTIAGWPTLSSPEPNRGANAPNRPGGPEPSLSDVPHSSQFFWSPNMRYHLAPLFCRPWTLNGISPRLIESHYENNYGGALNRLNAITEELEALDPATAPAHAGGRLEQEEMAALNPARLHELYFASLGGDGRAVPDAMAKA